MMDGIFGKQQRNSRSHTNIRVFCGLFCHKYVPFLNSQQRPSKNLCRVELDAAVTNEWAPLNVFPIKEPFIHGCDSSPASPSVSCNRFSVHPPVTGSAQNMYHSEAGRADTLKCGCIDKIDLFRSKEERINWASLVPFVGQAFINE